MAKPKPVTPITLADIANEARPSAYRSANKREGRGAPAIYTSISGVRISRKLFEEWICFAVWVYLLQGVRERGVYLLQGVRKRHQYGKNAFDMVSGLTATLARRMDSRPLAPDGVRRIWDRNWRRYARALADAHAFVHLEGNPVSFDRLTRPTRLKIMTADMLIKHTSPVRFPEL